MKKLVALGGGHGLSMVLRSLGPLEVDLTAIVSVADDGGSSGRLRADMDIVAPGDIRACMLALSERTPSHRAKMIARLFNYRFEEGELDGHSMGNLILVALARELGSFDAAVTCAAELLDLKGKVLPATESSVVLCAQTANGFVRGQVQIEQSSDIEKIFLDPDDAPALAGVVESILDADHIIYAPGSLFTSVIPSFVIPEIAHAIKIASADVTMIMNLVNRGPDTSNMTGDDHLMKVILHGGRVDTVVCDSDSLMVTEPPGDVVVVHGHLSEGSEVHDLELLQIFLADLLEL